MNEMCKLLRRYFSAFSKIQGYSNWVIAKVKLNICRVNPDKAISIDEVDSMDEPKAEILKNKKNYALMSVCGSFLKGLQISIDVHLIRITKESETGFNSSVNKPAIKTENNFKACIENSWVKEDFNMIFRKEEIIGFVNEVGDNNPIHRNNSAVVPGFLILEKILENIDFNIKIQEVKSKNCSKENPENNTILDIEIKYIMPVFAGENICVYLNENTVEGLVIRKIENERFANIKVFESGIYIRRT